MKRAVTARRRAGFTLIELMVVLGIVAVLAGLAAPSFAAMTLRSRLSAQANEAVSAALLARSEAIKRNTTVSMCVSSNGATCGTGGWEQGYLVMCNTTDNVSCNDAGTDTLVLRQTPAMTAGLKMTETAGLNRVVFQPTGVGATMGTWTICSAAPLGAEERKVRVSSTGRPSVSKETAGVCN